MLSAALPACLAGRRLGWLAGLAAALPGMLAALAGWLAGRRGHGWLQRGHA